MASSKKVTHEDIARAIRFYKGIIARLSPQENPNAVLPFKVNIKERSREHGIYAGEAWESLLERI